MRKVALVVFGCSVAFSQNVGIGTTSPQARLHVQGMGTTAATTALRIDRADGSPVLVARDDGRVGIGSINPAQSLDVGGNIHLTGDLRPAGDPGSASQIFYSRGPNQPPAWGAKPFMLWEVDIWGPDRQGTQGWSGANVTNCGGQYMLGGYGQCGSNCVLSKTYAGLPSHSEVMVEVFYFAVDSWDQHNLGGGADHMKLELDGVVVARGTSTQNQTSNYDPNIVGTNSSFCGATDWIDQGPIRVAARVAHTGTNLQVRIISQLSQASIDESLGVVAVRVWIR
ncbi:MAG: hypothetical protein ABDH66_00195 [Bacteroidia bacterium]